jgi:DNA ligase-1
LDGELFNDTLKDRLAELRKITGTSKPEKITAAFLKRSAEIVQYHVYDGWIADSDSLGPDVAYAQRFPRLVALLAEFSLGEVIQPLIPQKMTSWDDIQNWAAEYIATGGEGLILRVPDMTYEHKRSKNLIKIKEVNDAEFEIVGVAQGTGDWAAALRRFDLCRCASTNDCDISEDVFGADFKDGTIADAQDLWRRRDELIGKIVTVKYNGLTMYNTPNYAKVSFANNINLHKS